ncbi:gp1 dNMP kinase [Escherichia phage RB43]|uniref:Gp1 dNMP kinase n=1 Tax=Escherichia phage RB43 TaxID=2887182 RepID=Q56BK0_9CAUD|nr:gp1 dNMP kinase [Escherichia phage RB43]AAX78720.1 gp1 dNMP kinase [Escherichia phage RB43]
MIYCICGKKRTGKDTATQFVLDDYQNVEAFALADEIKSILSDGMKESGNRYLRELTKTNPFYTGDREAPLLMSNEDALKVFDFGVKRLEKRGYWLGAVDTAVYEICRTNTQPWTIRRLMQVFGTDIVCNHNDIVWVDIVLKKMLRSDKDNFIITDVRQKHEYKIPEQVRGLSSYSSNEKTGEDDSHSTEKGLNPQPTDIIILNNGTLSELKANVLSVINF